LFNAIPKHKLAFSDQCQDEVHVFPDVQLCCIGPCNPDMSEEARFGRNLGYVSKVLQKAVRVRGEGGS
jgi:hypothetical protein